MTRCSAGGRARTSVGPDRQVLSGLRAGERVVLSPPASLGDGAAVKLAEGG